MEKEKILSQIWEDKGGRLNDDSGLALYVALGSANPNLPGLTLAVFEAISGDPYTSKRWASTWGRVVVCVQPGGEMGCFLGLTSEKENKRFIPIKSTRKIDPANLIAGFPEGSFAEVLINDQPTTIEAFVISYVHMIDQLIWNLSREISQKDFPESESYAKALGIILAEGFKLSTRSENQILELANSQPGNVSVRLYGSKVNKDVPNVMGAILRKDNNAI